MRLTSTAALLPLAVAISAHAALTGCVVTATDFISNNEEAGVLSTFTRYQVFARFNGQSDTLLSCSNFCGVGFPCGSGTGDLYGDFWHYDLINTQLMLRSDGSWGPNVTGSAVNNRYRDSYLTIGGIAVGTNSTNATANWTSGGSGIHAGDARGWERADIVDNCLLGWFNSNPANLQGRVGVGANTSTDVMIGQFILLATEAARTYRLTFEYNDGTPGAGSIYAECEFEIGLCPSPGALAVFGLAGFARRRTR